MTEREERREFAPAQARQFKKLTPQEVAVKKRLEGMIERGLAAFRTAGEALKTIRAQRLWRDVYDTWEEYLRERWGCETSRARQLISAYDVARDIDDLPVKPVNEHQLRPLMSKDRETRRLAWARAVEISYAHAAYDGKERRPKSPSETLIRQALAELEQAAHAAQLASEPAASEPINAPASDAADEPAPNPHGQWLDPEEYETPAEPPPVQLGPQHVLRDATAAPPVVEPEIQRRTLPEVFVLLNDRLDRVLGCLPEGADGQPDPDLADALVELDTVIHQLVPQLRRQHQHQPDDAHIN